MKLIKISTVPISLNILLKGQLKFLSQYFEVIGIASEGKELEEVSDREGIEVITVNMERGISPIRDFLSLIRLYFILKKHPPFIIHSITPKAGLLAMLAGRMAGVPIRMHTFTGLIFPSKKGFIQKLLIKMDRLLCWAATNIYPEGYGVKNDLIKYNITSKPLKVLANGNVNGIDLDFFDPLRISQQNKEELRIKLNIRSNDFIFIFVGRLVGDKGINELVTAFSQLQEENIKLILVGEEEFKLDPLHPRTLQEIKNNNNIIAVGFQKDVRSYFAIANALVFPSYREGFPNVVMQAGAMGLPSIVSNINGCNEIIIENKNGIIVPVKNSIALRDVMHKLIIDEDYYNHLKINSRLMIQARYEQTIVWKALLEEYDRLVSKSTN